MRPASLRSDKQAALNHLTDVSNIDLRSHIVPPARRSWYHEAAPDQLTQEEKSRMDFAVQERLYTPLETKVPWRSVASAQAELVAASKQWGKEEGYSDIESWIFSLHH